MITSDNLTPEIKLAYFPVPACALIAPGCKALRGEFEEILSAYNYVLKDINGVIYFTGTDDHIFKIGIICYGL